MVLRITFITILLIFVSAYCPPSPAKENLKAPHKTYQELKREFIADQLLKLSKLKGQIKSGWVQDATRLARAIVHSQKGHHDAAASILKRIRKDSVLSDYAAYYRALALKEQKKYSAALKSLASLGSLMNPVKKIHLETFWLRMELLALTKQQEKMEAQIAQLKRQHPKDKWIDIKGDFCRGLAALTQGDKQAAYSHFTNVLVKNPGTGYDRRIFDILKKTGVTPQRFLSEALLNQRAHQLIENGFPHEALKIWERFYKKNPAYEERLAYGHYRARNYKTAAALYEKLLKNGNYKSSRLSLLVKLANSYFYHDNFAKAIEINRRILAEYPGTSAARSAKFKLGFVYFDSGQYEKSAAYFENFLNKGSRWERDRARWFRLWSFYLTKQYEQALAEIEVWEKENGRRPADKIPLYYWKARIAEKLGKKGKARALYQKVSALDGLDYYGLLARQRLSGKKLDKQTVIHPQALTMVPAGGRRSKGDHVDLTALPPRDPLITAILLARIGLDNFAYDETRFTTHRDMIPNHHIARAMEWAGNHTVGYWHRKKLIAGGVPGIDRLEAFRLAFPKAYEKFVKPYARHWGLDENLAYAVMRQESAFKPEALSYASAYGLMQIIPPTGDEIAKKIDFEDFEVSQLNDPIVNTLFGTFYLKFLMNEFDNDLVSAIASYNAGPHNVKRWRAKNRELERDEFIELIPYKETNKYVKKVLVNYLVYSKIYP